jgi:stearoyl-CoA desaturase (delta-9 desaturase)
MKVLNSQSTVVSCLLKRRKHRLVESGRVLRKKSQLDEWTRFSETTLHVGLVLMHVSALSAIFFPPNLTDITLFVAFYLATGFGVTIGFHRLLAHRAFECQRPITWLLAFLGTATLQGGPIWWVGVHRKHHQASDREGDPHSPASSFLHGHIGWVFTAGGLPRHEELSHDLTKDNFLVWLDESFHSGIPWLTTAVCCFLIGGVSGLVWGAVVRTVFVWHGTWCVNSVCHRWGSRPHKTQESSGNVWWVGIWSLGEGWHNNHHAHPRAAIHNYHWWEIDFSGYVLWMLERLGLVRKVIRAGHSSKTVC